MPTFIDLVFEQIRRRPEHIAVGFENEQISYAQLGERVDAFARYLLTQDYTQNSLIAVMMDRSIDMLVALLGILKSGHAYLPLDPTFPEDRLAYMLEHSQVSSVVLSTQGEFSDKINRLATLFSLELLFFSQLEQQFPQNDAALKSHAKESDLAYVIYTSGSTGHPKGVMVLHSGVSNFLKSMAETPGLTADDRLLAITTLSFDISVLELYLPLIAGAYLNIASKSCAADSQKLIDKIHGSDISIMQATPSTWKMMLDAGWQGKQSLKVLIGGEAPSRDVIASLVSHCAAVWNMYGPTETTVWSSCARIIDADDISIGRPINNTQMYVLDDHLEVVTPGTDGILYIGGSGLARGYLYRKDLSNERFVKVDALDGARLYNTGDVVCERTDGSFVYRGRADNQVKLRGFRIELEEIECQLNAVPAIAQSLVTVLKEGSESRLVAYLIVVNDQKLVDELSIRNVREALIQKLPDYMVPNQFAIVDSLPLTPNGKIDRKNLPDFTRARHLVGDGYVAPSNEMESAIAEVWQEVLGIDNVSVEADFYELGGHSLQITRIWTRLKARLGLDLPLSKMFDSPTVAALAHELQRLGDPGASKMAIPPVSRMKAPIMSLAQQRFWYIDQISPQQVIYNLCSAFRMEGDLRVDILEQSLNDIVQRHEILRTSLNWTGDYPKQIILKDFRVVIPLDDISHLSEREQDKELHRRMQEQVNTKIALDKVPLFRVLLYKLNESNHVFFFMPHHVIWDGWSFDVFLRELKCFYEARLAGTHASLEPLDIQYADYAQWHHDYLSASSQDSQLLYWRQKLGGDLPILDLPTDFPRPAQYSYNGATEPISFDLQTVEAINQLAAANGATVNMVLMAIYFVLLHRYSGQEDIIVGSPIQGRLNSETENLLGLFVNSLPLRVNLAGTPSFVEVLRRVKQTALEAYQNQEIPFERIVEDIVSERDTSRTPIFQALFTFQEVRERDNTIADLRLHQIDLHNGSCPTEISFWVKSSPKSVTGAVEYNPDLFSALRIKRLIEHLGELARSIVALPETTIDCLQIMTLEEQEMLLLGHNATEQKDNFQTNVIELIDKQARHRASALAIKTSQSEITYSELLQRSQQIAFRLIEEGVEQGQFVAVCMERQIELPLLLLAIWRCGAAYLPVDPAFPAERVQYILDHSRVSLLITQDHLLKDTRTESRKILIDELLTTDKTSTKINIEISNDMPAYVIYTSGSTGFPKGVVISHGAMANFLIAMAARPGLSVDDSLLAITTLSFDIHVLELWLPLMLGARLFLASSEQSASGNALIALIDEEQINTLQATPSTWNMLLACNWQGKDDLKALIGGEASPPDLIASLLTRVKSLWNMYGPTETTVWSSCHKISGDDKQLLIGKPIDNTQFYVLDKARQLVPHNIEGQLYIGGAGLSQGYLFDEQKTAEAFSDVKLPNGDFRRLYATGDLVLMREDGNLRYLRRNDNQVKVRGFRIELGEIEATFKTFPQVDQVAVIVREDRPGDQRLCAYYVGKNGKKVRATQTEFRKHLRKSLPAYMIPQLYMSLDELPLTPNGKVDRKALPAFSGGISATDESYVAPATEMEIVIAGIWIDLLGVSKAGIHDNFFELGGHSFLAIKMIGEVEMKTGKQLTPRDVVDQNLSQLAEKCEKGEKIVDKPSDAKPAKRKGRSSVLGLVRNMFQN